jgi:hypothetical protein
MPKEIVTFTTKQTRRAAKTLIGKSFAAILSADYSLSVKDNRLSVIS